MESDALFRYIVGYGIVTSFAILFIVIIGRVVYLFLKNVFYMSIGIVNIMKKIPSFLKSFWIRIKDYIIIACGVCIFILFISCMLYDCFGTSNNRYHDPDEYEEALQDGKWDVPSRYRE